MNSGGDFLDTLQEEDEYEEEEESEEELPHRENTHLPDSKPGQGRNSIASVISFKNEVSFPHVDEVTMKNMIQLGVLNDGQSRFGRSYRYQNRSSMHEYTVTQWDISELKEETTSNIITELDKLSTLKHSKIARFHGFYLPSETCKPRLLTMFRAFVPNGTLADKLKRGSLEERTTVRYFKQILEGLAYLHDNGIVHGNLKATNVLITLSNDIQLADVYMQNAPKPDPHSRRSLYFAAPEILREQPEKAKFTPATDIWAAGCILVMMVTRIVPYKEHLLTRNLHELREKIRRAHESEAFSYKSEELIPKAAKEIANIVDLAFTKKPESRPSASELLLRFFGDFTSFPGRKSCSASISTRKSEDLKEIDDFYNDAPQVIANHTDLESNHLLPKGSDYDEEDEEENIGCCGCFRWYTSKLLIFGTLLLKWIAMVLIAAISLALVAGSVFFAIFIIYNGIGVLCQCQLNEGFIVLIALILLPIIILLTTLCCNNSCEKYKQAVAEGKLERSKYVTPHPEEDIVLCGIIVVDGKKEHKHSVRRKTGSPEDDPTSPTNLPVSSFVRGVARLA